MSKGETMNIRGTAACLGLIAIAGVVGTGCGSSSSRTESSSSKAATTARNGAPSAPAGGAGVPSEAQSAATGDIPDNQVFLVFNNRPAGYSIRYPEGWARKGVGSNVVFQEKGNVIHVVVAKGSLPTAAAATAALVRLKRADPTIKVNKPQRLTTNGAPVVKVTYTRLSAPDPVTGKRLPLTIDRYVYARSSRVAVIDLGTPVGVDNVDAYRMISQSFRWL
jgi:hypothetical protein